MVSEFASLAGFAVFNVTHKFTLLPHCLSRAASLATTSEVWITAH